jgi:hypothetical protein
LQLAGLVLLDGSWLLGRPRLTTSLEAAPQRRDDLVRVGRLVERGGRS